MTEDQNSEPNRALELADELERIILPPTYYADELTLIAEASVALRAYDEALSRLADVDEFIDSEKTRSYSYWFGEELKAREDFAATKLAEIRKGLK